MTFDYIARDMKLETLLLGNLCCERILVEDPYPSLYRFKIFHKKDRMTKGISGILNGTRKNGPRKNGPRKIDPQKNGPQKNCPRKIGPRKNVHQKFFRDYFSGDHFSGDQFSGDHLSGIHIKFE